MMRAKDQKSRISMPHDAMIFVGDGQKALFLRNKGDEKFPNLIAERVFVMSALPQRRT
jgi:protein required for attachment to host cells